ncbi:hypothetical protein [Nonomuraea sp. NPDC050310]|uniref:hypothetical protein n=1 Tax=Nonomuraea sp. NPDC050310 TaxID=3154935 RepID=UPI0033C1C34B
MRLALAASAVGLSAATALVVASAPAQSEASLIFKYHCTGGVAGAQGVTVEAAMTPKVTNGTLAVEWALTYADGRRFGSPDYFRPGARLDLLGSVNITGAWDGILRPRGGVTHDKVLVPGDYLDAPTGLSDSGIFTRFGKVRLEPKGLEVKFTPAEGEVMINSKYEEDYFAQVEFPGGVWDWKYTPQSEGDHLSDVHYTNGMGAKAKLTFRGTQVSYIARRAPGLGPVKLYLDGKLVTDPAVEPGRDTNGVPMTGLKSKEVLWTSPVFPYGEHTLEVENQENKLAYLDAFRVITGKIETPPDYLKATCVPVGVPGAIELNIGNPTQPPTSPPPTSPSPTNTQTTPPPTSTTTPPPNPGNPDDDDDHDHHQNPYPIIQLPERAVGQRQGTTTTTTPTPTPKPTKTTYVKAQVLKTPKGGVASGEAPDPGSEPYYLLLGGSVLLVGSTAGGLMMRRRRVALPKGIQA